MSEILGCDIGTCPCKYLGLQLEINPLTKNQWKLMLDQVCVVIPAWLEGLIQRSERLVLVKGILSARLVHHLLVMDAHAWVFEEMKK